MDSKFEQIGEFEQIGDFEQIGAEEYAELSGLYVPLAAAVRALVAASLHTRGNPDTVRDATTMISAVTEMLAAEQNGHLLRFQRHEATGRPVVWPMWNGQSNCCNCGTPTRCPGCAPPPPWRPSTRSARPS